MRKKRNHALDQMVTSLILKISLGFILSSLISISAAKRKMLTKDGAAAAALIGGIVFGFGGFKWGVLLVLFFTASSLLTLWKAKDKTQPEHKKGRSAGQVLGSGGVAAGFALAHGLTPFYRGIIMHPNLLTAIGFAGAISAVCADTWAAEIGMLSSSAPKLITTGEPVKLGASGGITWLGTAGGAAGGGFTAIFSALLLHTPITVIWFSGFSAMLLDSLMGAVLEDKYPLFTNSSVNFFASLFGSALSLLL